MQIFKFNFVKCTEKCSFSTWGNYTYVHLRYFPGLRSFKNQKTANSRPCYMGFGCGCVCVYVCVCVCVWCVCVCVCLSLHRRLELIFWTLAEPIPSWMQNSFIFYKFSCLFFILKPFKHELLCKIHTLVYMGSDQTYSWNEKKYINPLVPRVQKIKIRNLKAKNDFY